MAEYVCSPLRDGHICWYIRGMVETTSMFVCTAEDQLIGRWYAACARGGCWCWCCRSRPFPTVLLLLEKGVARCYCAYKSTRCGKLVAVVQSSPGQNKGGRRLQVSRFSGRIMGWRDGGILAQKYGIGKDRNVLRLSLSLLFVGFYIILVLVCSLAGREMKVDGTCTCNLLITTCK